MRRTSNVSSASSVIYVSLCTSRTLSLSLRLPRSCPSLILDSRFPTLDPRPSRSAACSLACHLQAQQELHSLTPPAIAGESFEALRR